MRYVPSNFYGDFSTIELDIWMFTVTLLEMLSSRFNTRHKILEKVEEISDVTLKTFLKNVTRELGVY
jgi:hypothetical protein